MQENISTNRLSLHLLTTADYDFIQAILNTKGWLEFIGNRNVHSREDAIAYINKINSTPNIFYWVVSVKATNTPAGIISFIKRAYLDHFDIGFAFLPAFMGQGYACEAAKEVLLLAARGGTHHPILATTLPGNIKSIQLLTRLGLSFEREIEVDNETLLLYSNASNQ